MSRYRKLLLLLVGFVFITIIPFLILGESFEDEISDWFRQPWSPTQRFWLIVGLLAADIGIPIPSSAVSTYGGASLGFLPATIASWMGMTFGSLFGYLIARMAGPLFVMKLTSSEDFRSLSELNNRLSTWTIILTRPLPILAEAAILLVGALKLRSSKLLLPLMLSNLVIAAAYSAIGAWAYEHDVTVYVVIASIIIPLGLTWIVRRQLQTLFNSTETS